MALLLVWLVLGISFFAAPFWQERFGGASVRAVREWVTVQGRALLGSAPVSVPDPIEQIPTGQVLIEQVPVEQVPTERVPYETITPDVNSEYEDTPEAWLPYETGEAVGFQAGGRVLPLPITPSMPSTELDVAPLETGVQEPQLAIVVPTVIAPAVTEPVVTTNPVIAGPTVIEVAPNVQTPVRGFITAPNVRIRSTPDTTTAQNVVGWARAGDRFTVMEEARGRDGLLWLYVVYDTGDRRGWTSSTLLRLE